MMGDKFLVIDKSTRKLWRLQTSEKYIIKKINNRFEVFTKDLKFKADVSTLGTIILTNCKEYSKIDFYKLKNFCNLLEHCHFGTQLSQKCWKMV